MQKPFLDPQFTSGQKVEIIDSDEKEYIGLVGTLHWMLYNHREGYDLAEFREVGKGNKGLLFNITKDDKIKIVP